MDDLFGDDAWGEEPDWAKDDEDVEGGEGGGGEEGSAAYVGAQHVLLLIDCHADMFQDASCSPVDLALQLAQDLLQRCIRSTVTLKIGKRNGVGLLLYHTKHNRASTHPRDGEADDEEEDEMEEADDDDESIDQASTVHVLLPLVPPGVKEVKTIRSCLSKERDLRQEFCCSKDGEEEEEPRIAPLQTALEESTRIFRKAKCVKDSSNSAKANEAIDSRSIWIFSNRENPYPSSPYLIQNVARDAKEQGIQIVVWPLPSPTTTTPLFSHLPFYQDIASYNAFDHRLQSLEDLQDGLEDLQQHFKKIRRLYYGAMLLPDWREQEDKAAIMIDWYRFVQLAKKPSKVQIDQHSKQETIKVRQLVDEQGSIFASFKMSSAEERSKPQPGLRRIRQYAKFGNELVPISKEDLAEMKHQANGRRDKSGLILLGFKPRDAIPSHHSMGPTYLVYPNDDVVKGSCEAFMELHAAMLRKNVLAIGEVLHRIHWTSRLVAIYPIEEVLEEPEDGLSRQKRPPGMMVVTLPFEDDMRAMEPDAATTEFETLLSGMVMQQDSIMGEGSIKEDPDQVPSMSTLNEEHSGNVASEELVAAAMELMGRQQLDGMELGENFDNAALEEFFNYLESVALELPVSEEEEEYDTRLGDETVLEAARDQIERFQQFLPDDVEKAKATRKRKLAQDDSGLDWEDLYRSDAVEDCKVPQLKSYLRSVGEPLSGNKGSLVLRVTRHLQQQIENKAVKMET